jgi:hypothetical protein
MNKKIKEEQNKNRVNLIKTKEGERNKDKKGKMKINERRKEEQRQKEGKNEKRAKFFGLEAKDVFVSSSDSRLQKKDSMQSFSLSPHPLSFFTRKNKYCTLKQIVSLRSTRTHTFSLSFFLSFSLPLSPSRLLSNWVKLITSAERLETG